MQELDIGSGRGAALLQDIAERHGPGLASVARWPSRIFLLRSPFADAFHFVGAVVEPARAMPDARAQAQLSVGGSGLSLVDALTGCLGECAERLSQVDGPGIEMISAPLNDVHQRVDAAVLARVSQIVGIRGGQDVPFGWLETAALAGRGGHLLPADWCLRRAGPGPLAVPGAALSTGCAAGPSLAAAALSGVLELVERDAVAHWWIAGRPGRLLDRELEAAAEDLVARVRGAAVGRRTWFLDIGGDLGVPCVAAASADADGFGVACGFSARASWMPAIHGAFLELCQMELALALARAKFAQRGAAGLSAGDRRQLALARLDAEACGHLHPRSAPQGGTLNIPMAPHEALPVLLTHLAGHGISASLVDLTRPQIGVAAAFAVAPDLQLLPSDIITNRLARAMAQHGGVRETAGVAIL